MTKKASKEVSVNNMKKTAIFGYVYDFSAQYDATAVDDILETHKYSMKRNNI